MSFLSNTDHLKLLSNSEYEILEFIIKSPSKVSTMTIQELATVTYVSTASIMRLCKKLGCSGFTELKYNLKTQHQPPIKSNSLSFMDMQQLILSEVQQTNSFINHSTINEVTTLLLSDKNIHFFAKGISACVLNYFSKYLQTCLRKNIEYVDTHIAYLNAHSMTNNDVFILCSLSGVTAQVLKAAQIAKANGATIIAFTKMNNNPLALLADHCLYIPTSETINKNFDVQSRLSNYYIIDLIIMNYLKELN